VGAQLVGALREQGWILGRLAKEFRVTRTRIQQYEAGDGDS
jgi:predicted transcriptional regulator